ncbi:uncharacterized protein IWZ02DRAFT_489346 [Phyllosticta citriasiana]|uniref:Uncharacterized protein n=1 Tax=Phyllosticta citriasiana TaxID=595635 RepID=A0ABR1KQ28_9PEZI
MPVVNLASRDSCKDNDQGNTCEKPVSNALKTGVPIAIFVCIFLGAAIVFIMLLRKRRRVLSKEELYDKEDGRRSLDFDLDGPTGYKYVPMPAAPKKAVVKGKR